MARHVTDRCRVRLFGLSGKPELNGRVGKALRFLNDKDRWQVRLEGEAKDSSLLLKALNLQVVLPYCDVLAQTVLLARARAQEAFHPLQTLHVVGATEFELGLHFGSLAEATPRTFDGKWRTEKGNFNTLAHGEIFWFDAQVTSTRVEGGTLLMKFDGEVFSATMEDGGGKLVWNDGDFWIREEEASPLEVIFVGPDLPERIPAKEPHRLDWPEPGVTATCYRGLYEEYIASSHFMPADNVCLANPGLAAGGRGGGFFKWIPALHALAGAPRALIISTGPEPHGEGEFLGDGVYDEMILEACGFRVLSSATRSPHGLVVADHPHCGWHLWAFTAAFRRSEIAPVDFEAFKWRAYWKARRSRCNLPRFRFRVSAPEFRPRSLDVLQDEQQDAMDKMKCVLEMQDEEQKRSALDTMKADEAGRQETAVFARSEWLAMTVRTAWLVGGGATVSAAVVAGAVAAAEQFAEGGRSRPLPMNHQHILAMGAGEVALLQALRMGGSPAVAAVAAAAVVVFEALVIDQLWPQPKGLESDLVGHCLLGVLDRGGVPWGVGVVSSVGSRVVETHALFCGQSAPPLGKLADEMVTAMEGVAETAGMCNDKNERVAVAHAAVDNLDLTITARGGREAFRRIADRMHSAPPADK